MKNSAFQQFLKREEKLKRLEKAYKIYLYLCLTSIAPLMFVKVVDPILFDNNIKQVLSIVVFMSFTTFALMIYVQIKRNKFLNSFFKK